MTRINRWLDDVGAEVSITRLTADALNEDEAQSQTEESEDRSKNTNLDTDEVSADSNPSRIPSMSEAGDVNNIRRDTSDNAEDEFEEVNQEQIIDEQLKSVGLDTEKIEELRNRKPTKGVDNSASVSFLIPTLNPLGRGHMEIGFAHIEGTGVIDIPFDESFQGQPVLLNTSFGYAEIEIPTGFDFDPSLNLDIDFLDRNFGANPTLGFDVDFTKFKIPPFTFTVGANSDKFSVFNSFGDTWVSYVAVER